MKKHGKPYFFSFIYHVMNMIFTGITSKILVSQFICLQIPPWDTQYKVGYYNVRYGKHVEITL